MVHPNLIALSHSILQTEIEFFTLHSSLKLPKVFHQDFDLSAVAQLDDTLLSDLAYTLTSKIEFASYFFQTLLVATNAIAVAKDFAFTLFQNGAKHSCNSWLIDSKSTCLSVRLSSPEAITSTMALSSSSLPNGASILI